MVYIHVPFCRSFCTYCDFYSEVACRGRDAEAISQYLNCLCEEIAARKEETARTGQTNTLYFGGGTPSVLPLSCFEKVLAALDGGLYDEFTVEVNPEDIVEKGADYVRGLKSLGVNRVSMGVQSFDDTVLRWMNRRHDSAAAVNAFGILREAGIVNISIDLIFGLGPVSGVRGDHFSSTLDRFLELGPEHISAYQLSIEDGSALARLVSEGKYSEAPEDLCREQYDQLCSRLSAAGYRHYEVSNWALPGFEAKHNSAYWRRVPYVGLGPGAHSFTILPDGTERRSWNSESLSDWSISSEQLSGEDVFVEKVMLALRTADGIPAADLPESCSATVASLLSDGSLVRLSSGNLRIPESSFFISDSIIRDIISSL